MDNSRRLDLGLIVALSSLLAAPCFAVQSADEPRRLDAAVRGEIVEAPGTAERAEVVRFGGGVAQELLGIGLEQSVGIAGWPVAPGERADVLLSRHDVYASDAKIWRVEGGRQTEVARSRLAFFWGTAESDDDTRVFIAVDPDTGQMDGFAVNRRGAHEIHPLSSAKLDRAAPAAGQQYMVAPPETFLEQAGETPAWSCGTSGSPLDIPLPSRAITSGDSGELPSSMTAAAITSLHTAMVAVDTDNELLFNKFADNTATATNYIASLIAQMNVMYQRDLLIQLVQGTTFLRVGSSSDGNHFNDDPWAQPSTGGANGNQLNEVSNYWNTTNNAIARANVAMLSGKGGSGASGIAWIPGSLCSHLYGTSFSQVYLSGTTPSFGDVLVVGHEIGHNFGSPHTHCYSPPIDTCYNGEAANGCYSGSPSCPAPATINGIANVTGTLMSYCHMLGGCSSSTVFHPTTVALLQPRIQNAVGQCIFSALTVSGVSPATGLTTGGTAVTITGNGFVNGTTVSFGGAPASAVVVVNSSTITALIPPHAAGAVSATVTLPDASNSTKSNAFFYAPPSLASDFYTLTPCRVLDTRNANGPLGGPALGASAQRTFTVTGTCGIPSGADAIAVNVTAVSPSASGYVAIFPGNAFDLGNSLLNFRAGSNRADNAVVTLATDGTGTMLVVNSSAGTTNLIVDVVGYFN